VTVFGAARVVGTVLAVFFLAAAATIALVPLPAPAAGGTCGPSTSSESAIAAFFNPVSIGAGPEPSATSVEHSPWVAFVHDCQSTTNSRMIQSGVIVVGALLAGLGLPWAVKRFVRGNHRDPMRLRPPGMHPDREDPYGPRWSDERGWGTSNAPPDHYVSTPTV
jgi:hypothetical protein